MTLRTNISGEQRIAHAILDMVRWGWDVPQSRVLWALSVLGDFTYEGAV